MLFSAVIDMVDWERHDITHMLKGLPDATSRVIGVINKCDLKYPKANDFVSMVSFRGNIC